MLVRKELRAAMEAILFAHSEPITLEEIAQILEVSEEDTMIVMGDLTEEYNEPGRGIQIVENAQGFVMCTRAEFHEYIKRANRPSAARLSQAALETLAIIAYRQPMTRPEIETLRGVKSERVLNSLLARGLIAECGKKDAPGRPLLYATTSEFLKLFGLTGLDDLPRDLEEATP